MFLQRLMVCFYWRVQPFLVAQVFPHSGILICALRVWWPRLNVTILGILPFTHTSDTKPTIQTPPNYIT